MFAVRNSPQLRVLAARALVKGIRRQSTSTSTLPENLRKAYEIFQRDDGLPVHLKGGFKDRVMYISTLTSVIFGSLCSYYTLITMAFPKKK